jgi:electron transport complex protein RnfD
VLTGGLLLGAVFMATDYASTPINARGRLLFALGCGLITFVIRKFFGYPEGVSFSILLMNLLTPYLEELTRIKPLGGV